MRKLSHFDLQSYAQRITVLHHPTIRLLSVLRSAEIPFFAIADVENDTPLSRNNSTTEDNVDMNKHRSPIWCMGCNLDIDGRSLVAGDVTSRWRLGKAFRSVQRWYWEADSFMILQCLS